MATLALGCGAIAMVVSTTKRDTLHHLISKQHHYAVRVVWTGNKGVGTSSYRGYSREHEIWAEGKPKIVGSADVAFGGDPSCWNPEELLVAAISACQKLWYLALRSQSGVSVLSYEDDAEGTMVEEPGGGGQLVSATLRPRVTITANSDEVTAGKLHHEPTILKERGPPGAAR